MGKKTVVNTVESNRNKSSKGRKSGLVLAEIRKLSTLNIIDKIDSIIKTSDESGSKILWDSGDTVFGKIPELVIRGSLKKYIQVLEERYCLTAEQALFMSYFVKNCDNYNITYNEIGEYFNNVDKSRIIEHSGTLFCLVEAGYIVTDRNYNDEITFIMPNDVVKCVIQGKRPVSYMSRGEDGIKGLSSLQIVEKVVDVTKEKGLPEIDKEDVLKNCLQELGSRFRLNTEQALFLSLFVSMCDDTRIRYCDIARYFGVKTPCVMRYVKTIHSLIELGYIVKNNDYEGSPQFRMPETVIQDFMNDVQPQWSAPCKTPQDWMARINRIMERVRTEALDDDELKALLDDNFSQCESFEIVKRLNSFRLSIRDLKLYLILIVKAVMDDVFNVDKSDLRSYYREWDILSVVKSVNPSDCKLFNLGLIDYVNEEGRCRHDQWCLTDKSKTEVLHAFLEDTELSRDRQLLLYENIQEKPLYYCDEVTRQVEQLGQLLTIDNMNCILDRMAEKGMRKGFACLFYGSPGTGKTETVLQLARQTGRDIMQVDISVIRDKWVGETEKNIKQIFDRYRNYVKNSKVTPILLFNEADALFNTRNENSRHSVDKMENAMQNIILQELETLEGILIATTNLTQSMDPAFERRFLYKVEFTRPAPSERYHIWQSMLPELSDAEALKLAEQFDFSGGQIENITRKVMIDCVLWGKEKLGLAHIQELCGHELLNNNDNKDGKMEVDYMIA